MRVSMLRNRQGSGFVHAKLAFARLCFTLSDGGAGGKDAPDEELSALSGSRKECAPRALRVSRLHAGFRDLRACLCADGRCARLHAAAGAAGHRRLSSARCGRALHRREYRAGESRGFRLGRHRVRQRHACAGAADQRHRRARQGGGQDHRARRIVGVRRARHVSGFRLSAYRRNRRRDGRTDCNAGRQHRAAAAADSLRDKGAAAARRLSAAGLRPRAAEALFPCIDPIFQRLPVSLRILRHPGALRPPAAAEIAGADHPRARRDLAQPNPPTRRLFRRRQFHRQSQGGARNAAAPGRMAEAARLSASSSPAKRR